MSPLPFPALRAFVEVARRGSIKEAAAALGVTPGAVSQQVKLLGALGIENLPALGIESAVFQFNKSPENDFFLRYSDLNGHDHALGAHLLYKAYWLAFAALLGGIGLLFWPRGVARIAGAGRIRWHASQNPCP